MNEKKKGSSMFVYEGTLIWLLNRNNAKGIHLNDRDRLLNINSRSNNISKKYCELFFLPKCS